MVSASSRSATMDLEGQSSHVKWKIKMMRQQWLDMHLGGDTRMALVALCRAALAVRGSECTAFDGSRR